MKNIAFLTNAGVNSGVGYHAVYLKQFLNPLLKQQGIHLDDFLLQSQQNSLLKNSKEIKHLATWPGPLSLKTITWLRLGHALKNNLTDYTLVHATNQTLSFILPKNKPSILTVHDIIEISEPQQLFSKQAALYLYRGIKRASHLIAVSEYTKKTIQEVYNIASERITVIPNGVSSEFFEIPNFNRTKQLQKLNVPATVKIVLYVGSDHVRKNVITAIQAFSKVIKHIPEAVFIKIGEPGIKGARVALLQEIDRLGLKDSVLFVNSVSTTELNEFYNLADVLIFPSIVEGFGLPPVQAMASGTPVLTSNTTSLPEVVGTAGIMHDPLDVGGFAESMMTILNDQATAAAMRQKGLEHVKNFSWEKIAKKTLDIYNLYL